MNLRKLFQIKCPMFISSSVFNRLCDIDDYWACIGDGHDAGCKRRKYHIKINNFNQSIINLFSFFYQNEDSAREAFIEVYTAYNGIKEKPKNQSIPKVVHFFDDLMIRMFSYNFYWSFTSDVSFKTLHKVVPILI